MRNTLLLHDFTSKPDPIEDINKSLKLIQHQLLSELAYKQDIISSKEEEIIKLKEELGQKNEVIESLFKQVQEVERKNEGNKQLNKKLINEVVRKQQDIEWYKRTYESRSLLGTLKEKIFGK
ncbi:hypothetical protein [Rufibacter tibetensis]|uniref:Uncharacterized protein n=1 Tax=Rufibacter tibetensis TaxID=512763 RepID=A0A0P0C044_9BACT|nr:hypothetical protein [Rufibacter tibetensis]ALI97804.1 hypothetical protein DC20_00905 [Rufibacter tibetensis]